MWQSVGLTVLVIVATLICVLLFMLFDMSSSSGPLTEELQCSICLDVFTDPVSTPCGHNFCKTCLNKCWDNSQTCNSPYCKETFKIRPDLKINTTLREVVDHYKKKSPEKKPEVLCDVCEKKLGG